MNICKELRKWCKDYLNEDIEVILGEEYSYDLNDIITIPEEKEDPDKVLGFKNYWVECCLGVKQYLCDDTISFLHELGHQQTILEMSDFKYWTSEFANSFITKHLNKFTRYLYYRLPVESTATKWATEFYCHNLCAVQTLDMLFRKWRNDYS